MIADEFDLFRDDTTQNLISSIEIIGKTNIESHRKELGINPEMPKPNIMVVDDDMNIRESIQITCKNKYNVLLCQSGIEGIEKINTNISTVVLDIKMEGKNGFETFVELKKISPYIPIIFHSAYQDLKNPYEIMNDYRPFGYVIKEGEGRKLLHTIESAVEYYSQITKNTILVQKLQVQEERYRTLVNNLNVGVYRNTGGANGKFLQVNPALAKILGYESVEELMSKLVSELYMNPNERKDFLSILEANGYCNNFELKLKKKDETPILVSVSATVKRNESGQIEWMDGTLTDITEEKKAQEYLYKLNSTYQKFVPKQFLEFLGRKDITEIQLGDQTQKEMSILFSDIRSFTSLSEEMTSEENFKFINSFLKRIAPQIIKNNGFIDKYIGDAVMALFPDTADDAVKAAIQMLEELYIYNQHRKSKNYKPISIGIGINTGNLTLGIVGETNRMEGTVISDVVNLASRLEGLTKLYGASILISEISFQRLEDPSSYHFRIVDTVKVKGKKEPVTVIEILNGNSKRIIELKLSTKRDFEFGTALYQEKDFKEAKNCFRKVLEKDPQDKAATIYLKRSEYYEIHGITPEWEGIEELEKE